MLNWIIFVLTLCTSIMSVVHGVFIVLGALPVSGGASPALPVTIVAMMPIISAMVAFLGGVIALGRSKWSIIFLFAAAVACAFGSQDVWLYGGAYFFAGILCFFLRKKIEENDYMSDLFANEGEYSIDPSAEFNSEDNEENLIPKTKRHNPIQIENESMLLENDDINDFGNDFENEDENDNIKIESEPVKIRVRTSKSCPTCGNIVSREVKFCPNCGTKLYVDPSLLINEDTEQNSETISNNDEEILDTDSFQDTNEILKDITEFNPDSDESKSETQSENIDEQPEINPLSQNEIPLNQLDESQNSQNFFDDETPTSISNLLGRNRTKSKNSDYNTQNNNEMESEQEVYKASSSNFAQRKKLTPIKNRDTTSYQEFSNSKYSRRGKKRKSSFGKRVLSSLMLLVAVGGSLYFLLSLRKLPPGELPPIARNEVQPAPQEPTEQDLIAQPVNDGTNNNNTVKENILPAFNPEQNPKNGIITGNGVNMRSDHSLVARPVAKLSNNTRFEILDSWTGQTGTLSGTWYQVRTSNNREGWVYGRYVQPSGSGLPNGYSNALMKSFGSNKTELIESLGNPTRSTATSAEWQGLTASLRGNEITRIRVSASNRELQNGLKTGINQEALFNILGYPSARNTQQRTMQYNENGKAGINIQLDRNGVVNAITVNEVR